MHYCKLSFILLSVPLHKLWASKRSDYEALTHKMSLEMEMAQLIKEYELAQFFEEMKDLDEDLILAFTNDFLTLYIHDICPRNVFHFSSRASILTIVRAFVMQTAESISPEAKIAGILPAIWYRAIFFGIKKS